MIGQCALRSSSRSDQPTDSTFLETPVPTPARAGSRICAYLHLEAPGAPPMPLRGEPPSALPAFSFDHERPFSIPKAVKPDPEFYLLIVASSSRPPAVCGVLNHVTTRLRVPEPLGGHGTDLKNLGSSGARVRQRSDFRVREGVRALGCQCRRCRRPRRCRCRRPRRCRCHTHGDP